VGAGAAPEAAPSRAEGTGAAGTRDALGPAPSSEVGTGAAGTRGTPGVALRCEVGAGAAVTRGGPGATLSQEVGAKAVGTRGAPGAALSRESGTTPPDVVVPVTPLDNPHQMITRGKTGFKVVHDCLVLTAATSSSTPSPIPSFAHAVLSDPNWCAAMKDEYGALISNGI
jgi:hypothetical protein